MKVEHTELICLPWELVNCKVATQYQYQGVNKKNNSMAIGIGYSVDDNHENILNRILYNI